MTEIATILTAASARSRIGIRAVHATVPLPTSVACRCTAAASSWVVAALAQEVDLAIE